MCCLAENRIKKSLKSKMPTRQPKFTSLIRLLPPSYTPPPKKMQAAVPKHPSSAVSKLYKSEKKMHVLYFQFVSFITTNNEHFRVALCTVNKPPLWEAVDIGHLSFISPVLCALSGNKKQILFTTDSLRLNLQDFPPF